LSRLLIFLLILSPLLSEETENFYSGFSLEKSESGDTLVPNFFYPINLSKNYFMGIGYSSNTYSEKERKNSKVKNNKITTEEQFKINFISYKKSNIFFGINGEYINIENSEVGFTNEHKFRTFDNNINLDILRASLYLNFQKKYFSDKLFFRAYFESFFISKIYMEQETSIFQKETTSLETFSENSSQDTNYFLHLEAFYKLFKPIFLGFQYSYDVFPLKYKMRVSSQTIQVQNKNSTQEFLSKLIFNTNLFNGFQPTIGYGFQLKKEEDIINNTNTYSTNKIFTIGLEKRF
jgi:hypothetical protein